MLILAYSEHAPMSYPGHAVCMVGFREPQAPDGKIGVVVLHDGPIEHVYLHDDNLGPNVRLKVEEHPVDVGKACVMLRAVGRLPHATSARGRA